MFILLHIYLYIYIAEVRTNHDGSTIIPVKMDHNHHGDDRKAERKQLRVAVKRKEVDDIL